MKTEYKKFQIEISPSLKVSLKWYAYQIRIKITNLSTKLFSWYNWTLCSLDEKPSNIPYEEITEHYKKEIDRFYNHKPVDCRFPT